MSYSTIREDIITRLQAADENGAILLRHLVTELDVKAPWEPDAIKPLMEEWSLTEAAIKQVPHAVLSLKAEQWQPRGIGGGGVQQYDVSLELYCREADGETNAQTVKDLAFTRLRACQPKLGDLCYFVGPPIAIVGLTLVHYHDVRCYYTLIRQRFEESISL